MALSLFLVVIFFMDVCICQLEVPVIETAFGEVRGVYEEDANGQYFLYMGVPYGQPPKDNVFGDPVDPDPWEGVYEANSDSVRCPQREELEFTFIGQPDCLQLHVYVPANRTSADPIPVLYWIYGGGFNIGFAGRLMWGPEFLIRNDIIMVAVNYRIGPYGFMCLGTEQIPGNAGLKDILKGLRWTQNNIAAFGGNPNEITIGGSSAGAVAVEYLIVSPTNSNIYKRAILQSGPAVKASNVLNYNSYEHVLKLAAHTGYKGGSLTACVEFLKQVNHLDLIRAVLELGISFSECVEPYFDGKEAFFPKGHTETLESGEYQGVDVLLGFNCEEFPYIYEINENAVSGLAYSSTTSLSFENEQIRRDIADIIRKFYIGTQNLNENQRQGLADLSSDVGMTYAIYWQLKSFIKQDITAYFYEFCYDGGRNFNKIKNNVTWHGAMHADEIGYVFNQGLYGEIDENDWLIIDRITTMWANYVKYGDPTPEVTDLLPVKWLPVENGVKNFIRIDTEMSQKVDPNRERMAFWDLLIQSYFKVWKSQ